MRGVQGKGVEEGGERLLEDEGECWGLLALLSCVCVSVCSSYWAKPLFIYFFLSHAVPKITPDKL